MRKIVAVAVIEGTCLMNIPALNFKTVRGNADGQRKSNGRNLC